jgi:hypothetical protein
MPEAVAATLGPDRFTLHPAGDVQLQGIGRVALVHVARATS